jgi:hypothetical protein
VLFGLYTILEVTYVSKDRDQTEQVLPEDGVRIQYPKRCVLKDKQDDVLDKEETMDNVQKRNICRWYLAKETNEIPWSDLQVTGP